MALTRKMLKAMSIEDEQIEQIIEAHAESTDALKASRDEYKAEAEKIPELQKEIDKLNRIIELNEMPVMEATNGYTTSELFVKKVIESDKVDKDGRPIKTTRYELRYPETIVPVVEVNNEECPVTDEQISTEDSSNINNI